MLHQVMHGIMTASVATDTNVPLAAAAHARMALKLGWRPGHQDTCQVNTTKVEGACVKGLILGVAKTSQACKVAQPFQYSAHNHNQVQLRSTSPL
jgi:hypothetical protein